MKNKIKITIGILSVLLMVSCIWYDDDSYIPNQYKISRSDDDIVTFKNAQSATDTFRVIVIYEMEHQTDKEYHETGFIRYKALGASNNITIFQSIYDIMLVWYFQDYSDIAAGIGSVYYQEGYNSISSEKSDSYQQNGHIYPDVYTFEMDTVTAMENWDTTMNLFPDVRKVWYSLSRGIVRYDMKDGESYKLVE